MQNRAGNFEFRIAVSEKRFAALFLSILFFVWEYIKGALHRRLWSYIIIFTTTKP